MKKTSCDLLREKHEILREQAEKCRHLMTTDGILSESFIDAFNIFEDKRRELRESIETYRKSPPFTITRLIQEEWSNSRHIYIAARSLAGISTPESMKMRQEAIDAGDFLGSVADSLVGVSTPESMRMRREILDTGKTDVVDAVIASLTGIDTTESMEMRREAMREEHEYVVCGSLAHIETSESLKMREELAKKGAKTISIVYSFTGVSTPESMEMREKLIEEESYYIVAKSLFGDRPEFMKMRETLAEKMREEFGFLNEDSIANMLASFTGLCTPESMKMRKEWMEWVQKESIGVNWVGEEMAMSLAGIGTSESMEIREELMKKGADNHLIARSLGGAVTEEAEAFRKKHLVRPDLIAKSYATGNPITDSIVCHY